MVRVTFSPLGAGASSVLAGSCGASVAWGVAGAAQLAISIAIRTSRDRNLNARISFSFILLILNSQY